MGFMNNWPLWCVYIMSNGQGKVLGNFTCGYAPWLLEFYLEIELSTREGKWAKRCKKLTKIPDSVKMFAKWPIFQKVGKKVHVPWHLIVLIFFRDVHKFPKILQRAQKVAKMAKIHQKTQMFLKNWGNYLWVGRRRYAPWLLAVWIFFRDRAAHRGGWVRCWRSSRGLVHNHRDHGWRRGHWPPQQRGRGQNAVTIRACGHVWTWTVYETR